MPFDLPEAEQELIGGYHTEYSGLRLLLYLIAEFLHMVTAAFLITILFFGGWHLWGITGSGEDPITWVTALLRVVVLLAKVMGVILFFMLVRWSWPRFRFDQLMSLAWKVMLPLGMVNLVIVAVVAEYEPQVLAALGGSRTALVAVSWALAIGAWLIAGIVAPLSTDNRPRLEAADRYDTHDSHATAGDRAMKPNDPAVKWVEEPQLGLAGKMYLPLFLQGLTTTTRAFVLAQNHGQLSGSAAEDSQSAHLSWRASA